MLRSSPESKSAKLLMTVISTGILGAISALMRMMFTTCRDFRESLPTDPAFVLVTKRFPGPRSSLGNLRYIGNFFLYGLFFAQAANCNLVLGFQFGVKEKATLVRVSLPAAVATQPSSAFPHPGASSWPPVFVYILRF